MKNLQMRLFISQFLYYVKNACNFYRLSGFFVISSSLHSQLTGLVKVLLAQYFMVIIEAPM